MSETTHAEFVQGLRELADFYSAHSEVKLPYTAGFSIYTFDAATAIHDAVACARAFGYAEKTYGDEYFRMTKKFSGGISLEFCTDRQSVCTPVVVGTRVEPARVIPAKEEEIIPERVVEQIEWRCQSLLAAAAPKVEQVGVEVPEEGNLLEPPACPSTEKAEEAEWSDLPF